MAGTPRPAGGRAEREARARCAEFLAGVGFSSTETPFQYSRVPGLLATPGFGLAWIVVIAAVGHLGAHGHPRWGVGLLVVFGVGMAVAARWLIREGVLSLPFGRSGGINLVATRGVAPKVWLVAHIDSKSQPLPILVRALGIATCVVVWWAAVVVGVLGWGGMVPWVWITGAGVIAGIPVAMSWVGARSPGALDNASGVATVLLAAARVPRSVPVGVVLTSAEELGLAGARAFFRALRPPEGGGGVVLNCDVVDDCGYLTAMYSGWSRPEWIGRVFGGAARATPLPPGVLVDAVACREEGWEAVTLTRGTVRSWGRIHSRRDTADRLTGAGVEATATVLAAAVQALA